MTFIGGGETLIVFPPLMEALAGTSSSSGWLEEREIELIVVPLLGCMPMLIVTGDPPTTCAGCTEIVNGGGVGVIDKVADTDVRTITGSVVGAAPVRTLPSSK